MSKYLLIIILCLVIIGAGVGVYYFQKSNTKERLEQPIQNQEVPISTEGLPAAEGLPTEVQKEQPPEETKKGILLVRDEYSILIPVGWREVAAPTGVSAMVSYVDEEITDPNAKKINFKTYYSIQYDVSQNKSLAEYAKTIKTQLQQVVPGISFTNEWPLTVNSREAYNLEAELNQQGVDFKILMISVRGKGDDIWTIAFNTPKTNWQQYQSLFQEIIQSFEVK